MGFFAVANHDVFEPEVTPTPVGIRVNLR